MRRSPWLPGALLAALLVLVLWHYAGRRPAGRIVRASWTLTPGVLNPAVTQATIRETICVRGWTATVRPPSSYTTQLKGEQMRAYGLGGALVDYQEDHLISLELGGDPTDPRNLWPEPIKRALVVDQIENELNRKACEGSLRLAEAQRRESQLKHEDG
jgi:hypothetical protein